MEPIIELINKKKKKKPVIELVIEEPLPIADKIVEPLQLVELNQINNEDCITGMQKMYTLFL